MAGFPCVWMAERKSGKRKLEGEAEGGEPPKKRRVATEEEEEATEWRVRPEVPPYNPSPPAVRARKGAGTRMRCALWRMAGVSSSDAEEVCSVPADPWSGKLAKVVRTYRVAYAGLEFPIPLDEEGRSEEEEGSPDGMDKVVLYAQLCHVGELCDTRGPKYRSLYFLNRDGVRWLMNDKLCCEVHLRSRQPQLCVPAGTYNKPAICHFGNRYRDGTSMIMDPVFFKDMGIRPEKVSAGGDTVYPATPTQKMQAYLATYEANPAAALAHWSDGQSRGGGARRPRSKPSRAPRPSAIQSAAASDAQPPARIPASATPVSVLNEPVNVAKLLHDNTRLARPVPAEVLAVAESVAREGGTSAAVLVPSLGVFAWLLQAAKRAPTAAFRERQTQYEQMWSAAQETRTRLEPVLQTLLDAIREMSLRYPGLLAKLLEPLREVSSLSDLSRLWDTKSLLLAALCVALDRSDAALFRPRNVDPDTLVSAALETQQADLVVP